MNYLDYVNRTRIDNAKRLLGDSGRALAEVARACGYANAQSLNRFFKKYEGVTPGAYQRTSHQDAV
jgi:transcriptional regulator GlxA family with amidase domain